MPPNVLVTTMLWLGQSPGITFLAPPPPGPVPDYARPVVQRETEPIPADPVLGCIHRSADPPFDPAQLDRAAMRILQVVKWSRLREAEHIAALGPPAGSASRAIPRRPPSTEERQQLRALAGTIDRHWQFFEARVYEVRMFQHRTAEGRLACRRAAEAWDALLALLQQDPRPLPADLAEQVGAVDGWVGVLRLAASS